MHREGILGINPSNNPGIEPLLIPIYTFGVLPTRMGSTPKILILGESSLDGTYLSTQVAAASLSKRFPK